MLTFHGLSPRMPCHIEQDKLIVTPPLGEELRIDLKPTSFIRERGVVYDDRKLTSYNPLVLFAIGTSDGYSIVGTVDNTYMVLTPEGYLLNCSSWDSGVIQKPKRIIGVNIDMKVNHLVVANPVIPYLVHAVGSSHFAYTHRDYSKVDYYDADESLQMATAIGLAQIKFRGEDSYFIDNDVADEGISEKFVDSMEYDCLNDDLDYYTNCFWRYGPTGEIHKEVYNLDGKIGPYNISFYVNPPKSYTQVIPAPLVLRELVLDPSALAAYNVREQAIYIVRENTIIIKEMRTDVLGRVYCKKAYTYELEEPLNVPCTMEVGYKATKPLSMGVVPYVSRLLYDMSSDSVLGEKLDLSHAQVNPPLSVYKDMIENKAKFVYTDSAGYTKFLGGR